MPLMNYKNILFSLGFFILLLMNIFKQKSPDEKNSVIDGCNVWLDFGSSRQKGLPTF
jgi:hypothetical protein